MDSFRWLYKKSVAEVKLKLEPTRTTVISLVYSNVGGVYIDNFGHILSLALSFMGCVLCQAFLCVVFLTIQSIISAKPAKFEDQLCSQGKDIAILC